MGKNGKQSKWVRFRNKITAKILKWLGLEDVSEWADGGAPSSGGHGKTDDEVPLKDLEFCWGGTDASSAELDKVARIKGLKMHEKKLTFSWKAGGCENLGAKSREDYSNTFACLFCRINGKWKGGKFDEISTSRLQRDFNNIRDGYRGWDTKAIEKADGFAFMIISKGGRRRTNIIKA